MCASQLVVEINSISTSIEQTWFFAFRAFFAHLHTHTHKAYIICTIIWNNMNARAACGGRSWANVRYFPTIKPLSLFFPNGWYVTRVLRARDKHTWWKRRKYPNRIWQLDSAEKPVVLKPDTHAPRAGDFSRSLFIIEPRAETLFSGSWILWTPNTGICPFEPSRYISCQALVHTD